MFADIHTHTHTSKNIHTYRRGRVNADDLMDRLQEYLSEEFCTDIQDGSSAEVRYVYIMCIYMHACMHIYVYM